MKGIWIVNDESEPEGVKMYEVPDNMLSALEKTPEINALLKLGRAIILCRANTQKLEGKQ
tara:strand:- start:10911 stop:11090 length:180 start_codon:yes stop_codon:yes gene_type:complete